MATKPINVSEAMSLKIYFPIYKYTFHTHTHIYIHLPKHFLHYLNVNAFSEITVD